MENRRKNQAWGGGDVFLVATSDGWHVVGQVLAHEPQAMDSAACALFDLRVKDEQELESVLSNDDTRGTADARGIRSLLAGTGRGLQRLFKGRDGLPLDRIFSLLLITRDALDNGSWRVVKRLPVRVPRKRFPYEHLRQSGWVGAKIQGSGNVEEFLNAYYGLAPWDGKHDPEYFDKLLTPTATRPIGLVFQAAADASPAADARRAAAAPRITAQVPECGPGQLDDLDRQTWAALAAASDVTAVHLVQHYLYFPREQDARSVAAVLRDRGFIVEDRLGADGINWLVLAKSHLVPTEAGIARLRTVLKQVAAANNGQYDGWEARVEPKNDAGGSFR